MTVEKFELEMNRLKKQWPSTYSAERLGLLFKAYRSTPDSIFERAVTKLLLTQRAAPLIEAFEKAIREAHNEHAEEIRQFHARQPHTPFEQLEAAAGMNSGSADPTFVKDCLEVLRSFMTGKITKAEFDATCRLLDEAAVSLMKAKRSTNANAKPRGF